MKTTPIPTSRRLITIVTLALVGAIALTSVSAWAQPRSSRRSSRSTSSSVSATSQPAKGDPRELGVMLVPARADWSNYQMIYDRNLFLRNPVPSSGSSQSQVTRYEAPRPSGPARDWVLTGAAVTSSGPVAFLENGNTRATLIAHAGEHYDFGLIYSIQGDSLTVSVGGREVTVGVGYALDGLKPVADAGESTGGSTASSSSAPTQASSSPTASTGSSGGGSTTPSTGSSGSTSGASESDIIARMKAKRNQQNGGR